MARYSLQDRTVFITGGGSGIGAEVARQAAKKGARLAIVDVDGDAAERVASALPEAIAIGTDVRDSDSVDAAVERTIAHFGGIDVAFANAGIEITHTARGVPLIEMERIVDVNFTGVMRTLRATLPHVIERRGYVLITSSLAAILHAPPLSHYVATKAGVEAFGDAVRIEVRHKGVDVGVAYFGFIDTPMVARGKSDPLLAQFEREAGQNPIGKTYPVSGAAAAVVRGMERRARRVIYPRFIRGLMVLRSAMPRFIERGADRRAVERMVDALDERDLGAGGSVEPSREHNERLLS